MRRATLLIALLIVSAFFISACSRQEILNQGQDTGTENRVQQVIEPQAETAQYIDSQFIDPNETVEIGEMI